MITDKKLSNGPACASAATPTLEDLTAPTGVRAPISGRFRYWFDDGLGGSWIYGDVVAVGAKFVTVDFINGRRQRIRINSAAHHGMEKVVLKSEAALKLYLDAKATP